MNKDTYKIDNCSKKIVNFHMISMFARICTYSSSLVGPFERVDPLKFEFEDLCSQKFLPMKVSISKRFYLGYFFIFDPSKLKYVTFSDLVEDGSSEFLEIILKFQTF